MEHPLDGKTADSQHIYNLSDMLGAQQDKTTNNGGVGDMLEDVFSNSVIGKTATPGKDVEKMHK